MPRPSWLLVAALPAVFLLAAAAFVFVRAEHTLDRARNSVAGEGRFPLEVRTLGRIENPGFESIGTPATYSSGAFYQGKLYIGGPSGLFVFGPGDALRSGGVELLKSYRVGSDLPAAPLGQMVVGRLRGMDETVLMIATSGEGVLLFTGNGSVDGSGSFRQLRPQDAGARDVTALLPLPTGELLIGTRKLGVLVYRGQTGNNSLENFHPELAAFDISALAGDDSGFWAGTRNHGVMHSHAGQIDHFEGATIAGRDGGSAQRSDAILPDEQVDAITVHGDKVYVGTPLGVEEFVDGRPQRLLAKNVFANALYADDASVLIGSMDEGIRRVSLDAGHRPGIPFARFVDAGEEDSEPAEQFLRADSLDGNARQMYAVMRSGLRRMQGGDAWTPLAMDSTAKEGHAVLTDGNVSALGFAPDGRLWVGYFDHGLDIVSERGERVEHHEDDHLFCINRIVEDPRRRTMDVATANGLVLFDAQGKARQVLTRHDGLIADHVTDVAFSGESMVVATPAGLTFVDEGGARSLYAFQGLVNNHVYALGTRGKEVLAGTLGGVSELADDAVVHNFTAANSGLKHNWVTAIVTDSESDGLSDGGWMVGTYGAGVMRLDKDGRFTAMEGATREMVVNPNAMLSTGAHILVGTLGQGMWVWSRTSGQWSQVTAGLPSENVTAFAERDGEIYVGTENGLVKIAERLLN